MTRPETWVRSNRTPWMLASVLLLCVVVAAVTWGSLTDGWLARGGALLLGLLATSGLAASWLAATTPRLAADQKALWVYLNGTVPEPVPLEHVECFFFGQADSMLAAPQGQTEPQSATIVVRLAERALPFHNRQVQGSLGMWADGYIVIRGTWCEPIDEQLLVRLNQQLGAAHRRIRESDADYSASRPS